MPEINNSEIPVNPSVIRDEADARRDESNILFSSDNFRLLELNPVVRLEDWKRKLLNCFSLANQTINLDRIKQLLSETANVLTRKLTDIKESINLSSIKKELLSNIKLKGYKKWKV